MKNAYIVSLKFASGLASEFRIFGDNLAKHGMNTTYILCKDYDWLIPGSDSALYLVKHSEMKNMLADGIFKLPDLLLGELARMWRSKPPDIVIFYNQHPLNVPLAALALIRNRNSIRSTVLHEPYLEERDQFSRKFLAKIILTENLQRTLLKFCNHVILLSPNALRQFHLLMPEYGGDTHIAQLLKQNNPEEKPSVRKREFISFIGRMDNPNKGLDQFLDIVEYCSELNAGIRFQILTATPISGYVKDRLSHEARETLLLDVRKRVSDLEINQAMRKSHAVLLLHRHISQSGVLPVAYMNGAPVVCRDLEGFRQHVDDKLTGRFVLPQAELKTWLEAIKWVVEHSIEMSVNCHSYFDKVFSDSNWDRYYSWMIR